MARSLPIILVLLVLSVTTGVLLISEIAIAIYAMAAFLLRISSRTSFMLALVLLLATVVLQFLLPGSGLAENCAVYAFLFVVAGTISLALESRRLEAITYSIRRPS